MLKPVQASSYTFREIIEGGFVYVDKTRYLYELIRYNIGVYFVARPRRFGKSLMISTLYEIFQGNRELFEDLWLYESDYEWETYPIIRLDFSRHQIQSADELKLRIQRYLSQIAMQHQIVLDDGPFDIQLEDLILKLSAEKRVVILIDEYDKPIIDNIGELKEAQRIRDTLRGFYTTLKSMDEYIRFIFITGISKFSKVGVFSTMNHLDDLTMSPHFATAFGITETELMEYFSGHIATVAASNQMSEPALLDKLRHWYDGFCFVENCDNVYNPFSTLRLFQHHRFSNYWFETGTPTYLIDLIKERDYDVQPLDQLSVPELTFSSYEIESLELIPLLFQTGYLTIKDFQTDEYGEIYTLSYQNYEVKNAFLTHLLSAYNEVEVALSEGHLRRLLYALQRQDMPEFFSVLDVFFANIDYDLHIGQEKYYQTIFYLIFILLGIRVSAEVKTNRGRIDAVVELDTRIFLFEFKLDGTANDALRQIGETEYAKRYLLKGKPVTLVGANFESSQRKIVAWESEDLA